MEKRQSTKWKRIGQVGVDSGQVLIVDPCYRDTDLPDYEVTLQTAHGDGVYPVYARMGGAGVLELKISFE
jgi:hypothetical protein